MIAAAAAAAAAADDDDGVDDEDDEMVDCIEVTGACVMRLLGVEMAVDIDGINDSVGYIVVGLGVFNSHDKLRV